MFTMSSPATQYVYIPNLVGRQMLRIPLEEVEAEDVMSFSPTVSQSSNETMETTETAPSRVRDSSRSPSISSASSVEETE